MVTYMYMLPTIKKLDRKSQHVECKESKIYFLYSCRSFERHAHHNYPRFICIIECFDLSSFQLRSTPLITSTYSTMAKYCTNAFSAMLLTGLQPTADTVVTSTAFALYGMTTTGQYIQPLVVALIYVMSGMYVPLNIWSMDLKQKWPQKKTKI